MKRFSIHIILVFFILVTVGQLFGQSTNGDSLYATARSQAYIHQYDSAINNLRVLLANYPERYDAHLLLCSVYSWEQKFEQARTNYQVLLEKYPTVEVYRGAGRVEMWDAAWADALALINQGLNNYPGIQCLHY